MELATVIPEIYNSRYTDLRELATAMRLPVGVMLPILSGKEPISQDFVVGAIRAFPDHRLDELFYFRIHTNPLIAASANTANPVIDTI